MITGDDYLSKGGTSSNAINGISDTNANRERYLDAASKHKEAKGK